MRGGSWSVFGPAGACYWGPVAGMGKVLSTRRRRKFPGSWGVGEEGSRDGEERGQGSDRPSKHSKEAGRLFISIEAPFSLLGSGSTGVLRVSCGKVGYRSHWRADAATSISTLSIEMNNGRSFMQKPRILAVLVLTAT